MTDYFSDVDGLVSQAGVITCEVASGQTVAIGNVVKVSTSVTSSFPTIAVAGSGDRPLGVVVGLGEGASGAAGKKVSVAVRGSGFIVKVVASGTITVGHPIKAGATGMVADLAATETIAEALDAIGIALQGGSLSSGDEILLLLSR